MLGLFPRTPQEQRTAADLAARLGPDAVLVDGSTGPALRRSWSSLDAVVLFLPAGAAVRSVAPLLRDEASDPDVVCVDERFAVTVSGGSRALAERISEMLGLVPVVTAGAAVDPLDEVLDSLDATADGSLAECGAAIAGGAPVLLRNPRGFPMPALPSNVSTDCDEPLWTIVVDDRRPGAEPGEHEVRILPRTLVVGIGSVRGVSRTAVTGLIAKLDREHGLDPRAVRAFATAEAKADESGILEAVQDLGFWHATDVELPLRLYPADELAGVPVPNPSSAVLAESGTPSVAEAAALRAAEDAAVGDGDAASGADLTAVVQEAAPDSEPVVSNGRDLSTGPGEVAELVVPKISDGGVTVAVARVRPRGRLTVIGLGPGPADLRTPRAETELRRAAAIVGRAEDLDLVGDLVHPGAVTHAADSGCAATAAALAREGRLVALVTTGDGLPLHTAARAAAGSNSVQLQLIPGVRA